MGSSKDRDTPPEFRARVLGERYGNLHAQLCDKGEASLARALAVHGEEAKLARAVFEQLGGDPRRVRRFNHALRRLLGPRGDEVEDDLAPVSARAVGAAIDATVDPPRAHHAPPAGAPKSSRRQ